MQTKGKYSWTKHLDFFVIDLLSLLLAYFIAYFQKFHTVKIETVWQRYIAIVILIDVIIYLSVNPYSGFFRRRYYYEISKTIAKVAANAICTALTFYILKLGERYSREVFILTYVLYFFISIILKYVWKKLLVSGKVAFYNSNKTKIFIVSNAKNAERDVHSIYSIDLPLYEIIGIYLVDGEKSKLETVGFQDWKNTVSVPVIHSDFDAFILRERADEVLITVNPSLIDNEVLKRLIANGIGISFEIGGLFAFQAEDQFVANLATNKVLHVGDFSFTPKQSFYLTIKRLFDITCGLIGIVVLVPVTFCVKLAYLLSGDTARIFYRQRRVGKDGKLIYIWKYRSMVPNAGEILEEMLKEEHYRKEWGENQKFENDPRITKVGSILRKTSIDELPQLINVLKGDMSLVGPRPLVVGELEMHNGLRLYNKVKPGITGWWGCNGRSNLDYRERLELEYYYVKNCSLYLDILCMIRTAWAVLKKDGAQ